LEKEDAPNIDVKVIDDSSSKKSCRKSWSQLIYKIYEVNPLKCPCCGSEMKIVAFIRDYQEIKKILNCFSLFLGYFAFFILKMKILMVYTIKIINYSIDYLTINNQFFNISI